MECQTITLNNGLSVIITPIPTKPGRYELSYQIDGEDVDPNLNQLPEDMAGYDDDMSQIEVADRIALLRTMHPMSVFDPDGPTPTRTAVLKQTVDGFSLDLAIEKGENLYRYSANVGCGQSGNCDRDDCDGCESYDPDSDVCYLRLNDGSVFKIDLMDSGKEPVTAVILGPGTVARMTSKTFDRDDAPPAKRLVIIGQFSGGYTWHADEGDAGGPRHRSMLIDSLSELELEGIPTSTIRNALHILLS